MGPWSCTTSGAGGGRGLVTTAGRGGGAKGAWPKGAGTTVPGWARGRGAGAPVLAPGVEGHGGRGVVLHAVNSAVASSAETFHGRFRRRPGFGAARDAGGVSR